MEIKDFDFKILFYSISCSLEDLFSDLTPIKICFNQQKYRDGIESVIRDET